MLYEVQTSKKELKAIHRQCWSLGCKHVAFLMDWCGWKWCLFHWYTNLRWNGGSKWFYFQTTELF